MQTRTSIDLGEDTRSSTFDGGGYGPSASGDYHDDTSDVAGATFSDPEADDKAAWPEVDDSEPGPRAPDPADDDSAGDPIDEIPDEIIWDVMGGTVGKIETADADMPYGQFDFVVEMDGSAMSKHAFYVSTERTTMSSDADETGALAPQPILDAETFLV